MTKTLTKTASIQQKSTLEQYLFLACVALLILLIFTDMANATNSAMGNALCTIVNLVYGNLGRGLATLAVIILGVGATLGKTSWGLAITVAVGIAVIFNSKLIVASLGANALGCP